MSLRRGLGGRTLRSELLNEWPAHAPRAPRLGASLPAPRTAPPALVPPLGSLPPPPGRALRTGRPPPPSAALEALRQAQATSDAALDVLARAHILAGVGGAEVAAEEPTAASLLRTLHELRGQEAARERTAEARWMAEHAVAKELAAARRAEQDVHGEVCREDTRVREERRRAVWEGEREEDSLLWRQLAAAEEDSYTHELGAATSAATRRVAAGGAALDAELTGLIERAAAREREWEAERLAMAAGEDAATLELAAERDALRAARLAAAEEAQLVVAAAREGGAQARRAALEALRFAHFVAAMEAAEGEEEGARGRLEDEEEAARIVLAAERASDDADAADAAALAAREVLEVEWAGIAAARAAARLAEFEADAARIAAADRAAAADADAAFALEMAAARERDIEAADARAAADERAEREKCAALARAARGAERLYVEDVAETVMALDDAEWRSRCDVAAAEAGELLELLAAFAAMPVAAIFRAEMGDEERAALQDELAVEKAAAYAQLNREIEEHNDEALAVWQLLADATAREQAEADAALAAGVADLTAQYRAWTTALVCEEERQRRMILTAEALERGGALPEPMERGELAHAMAWNVAQGRLLASRYAAAPPEFLQRLFAVQRAYLAEQQQLRDEYDAAHASLAAAVAREVHGME